MTLSKLTGDKVSKYDTLKEYLASQTKNQLVLTFQEIESSLKIILPASARKHRAWWGNDISHTQARNGWLAANYEVASVEIPKGIVKFERIR